MNENYDRNAAGIIPANEDRPSVERTDDTSDEEGETSEDRHGFESILNSRARGRGIQYRVKWHYPHLPAWEPSTNLRNGGEELTSEFHRRNPGKPGPPS